MTYDVSADVRLDPRVRDLLLVMPPPTVIEVVHRDELVREAASEQGLERERLYEEFVAICDTEEAAPSTGLHFDDVEVESRPDGNRIRLQVVRPDTDATLAAVYYIHGGGMASSSSYHGNYRSWARIVAGYGVAVVMVEFRNSISPSRVPEIAPYPAGLNDCLSGLLWLRDHADRFGIDAQCIVVAGESGGGNLALACGLALKRRGELSTVKGIYALCPYIAGRWPDERFPSSIENNGIFLNLFGNYGAMSYGIDAFEAGDPLAWPAFATVSDVVGFPPTVISVNECDPLRDEGIAFYRLLLRAGYRRGVARCSVLCTASNSGSSSVPRSRTTPLATSPLLHGRRLVSQSRIAHIDSSGW